MPRQDVPYGGAICRLRERIAEIFDLVGEKLHSINGVQGDGDGNVKIVSGSSAVVINNDPTQNEIAVSLDTSQLPAAAVSSVNGQTGAVALTADDIPSDNGDVQTDLDNLEAADTTLQGNINAEALARQNADNTLQTNINTVSVGIPAAAAAAVAADPTVAQLATDVPNKLDKITSGNTLKAYSHTGATQGETAIVDGTAANSIGIRDANGRMQAADPASDATDKTLVTANWVSQTGDSAPNNLIHKNGNETKNGTLKINNGIGGYPIDWHALGKAGMVIGDYCIFAEIGTNYNGRFVIIDFIQNSNTSTSYGKVIFRCNRDSPNPIWLYRKERGAQNPLSVNSIHLLTDGSKMYLAWYKENTYGSIVAHESFEISYGVVQTLSGSNVTWYTDAEKIVTNDISGYTDIAVIE